MTPRVEWDLRLPSETRAAFEEHFLPLMLLLPAWVTRVHIEYDSQNLKSVLWTRVSYEYRHGTLAICPGFLDADPGKRRSVVAHEILHFSLDPVNTFMQGLLERFADNPDLQSWAHEQRRIALESTTCDLTESLLAALATCPRAIPS